MEEPTKSILLAHEMDQGKSVQAIEFALRMGFRRVLFVGIKDTWEQFHERALAQSDRKQGIRRIDSTKAGKLAQADLEWGKDGWFFIGHQLFNSKDWETIEAIRGGVKKKVSRRLGYWDSLELDLLVYDEVHVAAAYKTNGSQTLHSVQPEWKIAMSGTFYANKFQNAWAPTFWLWPDLINPSFWAWKEQWVQEEVVQTQGGNDLLTPRGQQLKRDKQPIPEREKIRVAKGEIPPEGRFVKTLPCYIRFVGEDPVPEAEVVLVDLLPEQRRMYDALERDALVWIRSRPFVVELPLTLRERLRTATLGSFDFESIFSEKKQDWVQEIFFPADSHSTKLDALFKKLAKFPDDRVVLGTHSKKFAKLVAARMVERGMNVAEWNGGVNSKRRQQIKELWLADELQYIVTVFKSFDKGLDWAQHNCWRMGVLSEQVGDPTAMAQWVRRVFRTGPHKAKFSWFTIHARNTFDSEEYENRELQQELQQRTLHKEAV